MMNTHTHTHTHTYIDDAIIPVLHVNHVRQLMGRAKACALPFIAVVGLLVTRHILASVCCCDMQHARSSNRGVKAGG